MSGMIKCQQQQKNHGNNNKHKRTLWKSPTSCFTSQNESSLKKLWRKIRKWIGCGIITHLNCLLGGRVLPSALYLASSCPGEVGGGFSWDLESKSTKWSPQCLSGAPAPTDCCQLTQALDVLQGILDFTLETTEGGH